jgi:hypothetical protein
MKMVLEMKYTPRNGVSVLVSSAWSARTMHAQVPAWVRYVHMTPLYRNDALYFNLHKLFVDSPLVVGAVVTRHERGSLHATASLLYYLSESDCEAALTSAAQSKNAIQPWEILLQPGGKETWGKVTVPATLILPDILGMEVECQLQ